MFVQVFHGHVTDAQQVRQLLDEWVERVAPGADGWLGCTAGVTDDGELVCTARFESADAARRNSGRAQQGEWWSAVSKLFTGEAQFHDCSEVYVARAGGSDDAGFVQVIQGRSDNLALMREMNTEFEQRFPDIRPDLIGYLACMHDDEDGAFTQVAYFTSEQEARVGETQELPPEAGETPREEMNLLRDVRYLDLHEPWLYSPR